MRKAKIEKGICECGNCIQLMGTAMDLTINSHIYILKDGEQILFQADMPDQEDIIRESTFICPACGREYSGDEIVEAVGIENIL